MSSPPAPRPRLAIDIGGTFTDIAVEHGDGYLTSKVLTTRSNPVEGVLEGARITVGQAGIAPAHIGAVIHGTTLATNALIERRGATVGALVTEGFRDILEIAYERRYDQYDLYIENPDRIVSRDRVRTVEERLDARGRVLTPLSRDSVIQAVDELLALGVDSFAVCLLHSYGRADHELAIRDILAQRAPGVPVSLSCEVSPEVREFDRLSTTVANAYIKPLMARYLRELADGLVHAGFDCPLRLMTSAGGMTTLATAMELPVRLVESGPSGGAVLAANVAVAREASQVLSFDMGGTTAKVCLIEDGQPRTSRTFEVGRAERFIKGSGLPVRIPVLEMIEIGAGGGSIASVDGMSRLKVGPRSASSDPGPACYGRGGDAPTVTDADALIGYLEPESFAEGRIRLDLERSREVIERDVCAPLGLEIRAGTDGISRVVDEAMANAARMHAVEQGKNLRECVMVAFGGNGPLHATRVAEKVGIREIVVPPQPGVGSAVGFLSAPVSFELVRSHYVVVDRFDFAGVNRLLADMVAEGEAVVRPGTASQEALEVTRTAFMRYVGQGHEIEVDIAPGTIDAAALDALVDAFERDYERLFSRGVPGMNIEIMNWSVRVATPGRRPAGAAREGSTRTVASERRRALRLGHQGREVEAAVFERSMLAPGDRVIGPALIVEPQTTTFVAAGFDARVDSALNIVMTRDDEVEETTTASHTTLDLQVMWDRMLAVVEEQGQVLVRTAFSPLVRECGDISAGIFDLAGRMLAQAVTGTPGHINTMAGAVSIMLEHVALEDMRPGDVYLTNDPWIGSGHLNDVLLLAPIFAGERLVALTSCTSHMYDVGGLGMTPNGSDVHDEGLFIPPMKICDRGAVSPMFVSFLKANSRCPESNEGDLYALIACCDVAARRVADMVFEFGLEDLDSLGEYILERSSQAARDAIAAVPNGVYENEMMLDGYDFEILLKATMTVSDDAIVTDFAGSSPCSRYGINVPLSYAEAYSVFGIRCVVGPGIPNNAGSLAPFRVTAPRGCILNAPYPAPVAMRHTVGQIMPDLVFGCLRQALPGRIPAEGSSCMWDLSIRSAALAQVHGNATVFAMELTHNGGTGARPELDGLSATAYPSGVWGSQVEITESVVPVRVKRRELIPDSGGPGARRGGLGQIIELESAEEQPFVLMTSVERMKYPARGAEGGGDGRTGRIRLRSGPAFTGKAENVIPAGDLLYFEAPGGGGYGDPVRRDVAAVERDVRHGLVSVQAAAQHYGVVLRPDGAVDQAATARRRDQMGAASSGGSE